MNEKQLLVTLLQLLVFVRGLTYTPEKWYAKYRKYSFPLRSFSITPRKQQININ
jgi:hypothetical protein